MRNYILFGTAVIAASLITGCGNQAVQETPAVTTQAQEESSAEETQAVLDDSTKYPFLISVSDAEGNRYEQSFSEAPKRVVTNNQATTELLLLLGLEDYVVGTGDLDNQILPELKEKYDKIPAISEKGQVAKEVVIGADPDAVMGRAASFTDETYGTIKSLNEMGIQVYVQEASRMNTEQTVDNILTDIRNTGKIFNIQKKADQLADQLQERMDQLTNAIALNHNQEPLNVLLMVNYVDGNFGGFGRNASLQVDMLNRIHAVNVLEKGGSFSVENLIVLNPDVIVYIKANKNTDNDGIAVENILNNELLQDVNAVRDKKIVEVEYTEIMGYGFRTIDCMETLAKACYPESFTE